MNRQRPLLRPARLTAPWVAVAAWLLGVSGCGTVADPSTAPLSASGSSDALAEVAGDALTATADGDAAEEAGPDGGGDTALVDSPDALQPADAEPEGDGDATAIPADGDATTGLDGTSPPDALDATDAKPQPVCAPGTHACEGAKLATCGSKGDGWIYNNCFPGTACEAGECKAVSHNLIILFDTSGSMSGVVKDAQGKLLCSGNPSYSKWPVCEYDPVLFPGGCTRMGVSKFVFKQALAKIEEGATRMAMFRFPQVAKLTSPSCTSGYYAGDSKISGDPGDETILPATAWFWSGLAQTLCVAFPTTKATGTKAAIVKWMDGSETETNDPELRPNGGTPIGKTLFYLGEYLRHKVVVDGMACSTDADCANANYLCQKNVCVDPARSCRETVVVVFTDGGEANTSSVFAPWVQAKRLSTGLGCQTDLDCVGGAVCSAGLCRPKEEPTGYACDKTGKPCSPAATSGNLDFCAGGTCMAARFYCPTTNELCIPSVTDPTGVGYCATTCYADPRWYLPTKSTKEPFANVLRSPDGKPFGVRMHVVDISGSTSENDVRNAMSLALAGQGKRLGADAGDPDQFLKVLESAFDFDLKNKKVCGAEL